MTPRRRKSRRNRRTRQRMIREEIVLRDNWLEKHGLGGSAELMINILRDAVDEIMKGQSNGL